MAQPTAYTPATDFSDDEANAVGGRSTVRTAALDAEFSALNTTLDGVLASIALNQRDDGEIKDGRVKLHTLAADVRALLVAGGVASSNLRGDWVTATAYVALDLVTQGGNTYLCAVAHTSGTFATDLAADKWLLIAFGSVVNASAVVFAPTATLAATTVQAAIEEADTEGRALTLAVRSELADVSAAGDGDAMVGWGAIFDIRDGVLTRHASLAAAVAAIGSTRCTVVVRDDVVMAGNASFPATCTVRIENRAQITTTGFTLTFGAKPQLHPGQNFAGSGAVVFSDGVDGIGFLPQWWGAKADNSTDDRAAIQAAINAAQSSGASVGGSVVYLAPSANYYRLTAGGLTITASGITLMGAGSGSAINHTGTGDTLQIGDNVTFLRDVHIVGINFQTSVASARQILVRKAPNTKIDRCIFSNAGTSGDGIRLTESWCTNITNCVMGSIRGYGIHASNSANGMHIAGNRIDGFSTSSTCGIYIDGEGNAVVGNTVETWDTCINPLAFSGVISGNYLETYVTGILGNSSLGAGYDIRGNYFAPSGATVVSIKLTAGNNIKIGPNKYAFTHTGGAPIELTAATRVFIEEGQEHVDTYTVKWPRDHVATWLMHREDNNRGFNQGYIAAITHTGTTSETTLRTYTGVKEDWGTGTRIDVRVAGTITGTSGQKDIRLKLAGTTIATVTEAAGATDDWIIEASIDVQGATTAMAIVKAWQAGAVEVGDVVTGVTLALDTTNPTITVTGQLGNTGDSIIVTHWMIELRN